MRSKVSGQVPEDADVKEDPAQVIQQVARRIAELRQGRGMTQQDLAQKLEAAYQNVQRIERGEQNLTIRTMARLANALGVRIVDLFAPPGSALPQNK